MKDSSNETTLSVHGLCGWDNPGKLKLNHQEGPRPHAVAFVLPGNDDGCVLLISNHSSSHGSHVEYVSELWGKHVPNVRIVGKTQREMKHMSRKG